MKKINQTVLGLVAMFLASAIPAFAIEGLNVAVSTNTVLTWPSDTNETYLIQYRHTLDPSDSWSTLADLYPADCSTNITVFVDTNAVDWGSSGASGGDSSMMLSPSFGLLSSLSSSTLSVDASLLSILMPPMPTGTGNHSSRLSLNSHSQNTPGAMDSSSGSGAGFTNGTGFYQVVRDGVHMMGTLTMTNTALSGVVSIPVEYANGSGDITTMSICEDDVAVGNSIQTAPISIPPTLALDTTAMSNGVHLVYAYANWDDGNGGTWDADSPVISITVSNEISFPNWMPYFGELGNSLLIRATSAHADTDWYAEIYDSSNTLVRSFTGHTDDGDISIVWDLLDANGNLCTNINSITSQIATPYTPAPTNSSSVTTSSIFEWPWHSNKVKNPPSYKVTDPWPAGGAWAMACQHAFDDNGNEPTELYAELNDFVTMAYTNGGYWPPINSDGSPYTLAFGRDNPQGDTNWGTFRQVLFDPLTRNLVYFGHGGEDGMGYNTNTVRFIKESDIAASLHTIPAGQTNRHAFRFVFLDACKTANGEMPESFGILHRKDVPRDEYVNSSTRLSAYVGWPESKGIEFVNSAHLDEGHINFIEDIQIEWAKGIGIKEAIKRASHYANTNGEFGENDLQVFGCWTLTTTDNND